MSIITDTIQGKGTPLTIKDTISGTPTPQTVKDTIDTYIKTPADTTKRYQPNLDMRLRLEVSGANVLIEDDYRYRYQGLDMDFHIIKSYENSPQESEIKIYNLSTETYNLIYEKGEMFRLSCARGKDEDYTPFYTGQGVSSLKVGGKTVLTHNEGFMAQDANAGRRGQNDLETTIKLMSYGVSKLYKSYQSAVSSDMVIEDCRIALGLPKGNMDKITSVMLPAGYTIRGSVNQTLNNLGNMLGFTWNCNDMALNIYDKSCSEHKPYGIILNGANSNIPERQEDKFRSKSKVVQKKSKKKGIPQIKEYTITREKQGFKIETMFLPFLQVGSTCYLNFDMSGANGVSAYIYRLEHSGSNVGTDCKTIIYCV